MEIPHFLRETHLQQPLQAHFNIFLLGDTVPGDSASPKFWIFDTTLY
jgi:hypothetical protein